MMSFLARVAALAVQAAIVLVIVLAIDFAFTTVCGDACDGLGATEHRKRFRIKSDIYHHDLAPNTATLEQWGDRHYPVFVDSLGFKDAAVREVPLASDAHRVLLLGDSLVEGLGVPYPDTVAGRLDAALAPRGIEVLNAAVTTYSPSIYFAKARHLIETVGLEVDEVVVFIDASDPYDEVERHVVDADGRVRDRHDLPVKGEIKRRLVDNLLTARFAYLARDYLSYFGRHIRFALQPAADQGLDPARQRASIETAAAHPSALWSVEPDRHRDVVAEGTLLARRSMDGLHEFLAARHIPLTVVVYPWPVHILHHDAGSLHRKLWRDWAAAARVPLIDLFPDFLDAGPAEAMIARTFIPFDVHWNEAGHALVAEALLARWRPGDGKKSSAPR